MPRRSTEPVRIVAHRGVTGTAHENTMAAFEAAIRLKADFLECDLRRTADGRYIIHHDPTAGARSISRCVLADLKAYGQASGYEMPTLDELLDAIPGRIGLDLELKEGGYERDVLNFILRRTSSDRFVITSFHPGTVKAVKTSFPDVRCGILLPEPSRRPRPAAAGAELPVPSEIRRLEADFIAAHWKYLGSEFLRSAIGDGFPIWVWTVNERTVLEQCLDEDGIEAVITDDVQLALALRAGGSVPGWRTISRKF